MRLYFIKCKPVNNLAHAGTGKTVMTTFDNRNFRKKHQGEACRRLFVAHREEILTQSRNTFQGVLRDLNFGELFVGNYVPEKESTFSPIKKGATGDSVAEIQKRLVELGYLTSADGSYGPGTEQAIKNFQAANGLGMDGVVNENTYNKMFSSEAKRYVAPTPTEVPEQSYTRAAAESPQERLVWITKTGKRYHSRSNCGSTNTAWQIVIDDPMVVR